LNTTVETRELLECLRLLDVVHASQTRAEQILLYQTGTAILERMANFRDSKPTYSRGRRESG
jgi:hypothetical protein